MAANTTASPHVRRPPDSGSLHEVLGLILDEGIVIDAFARVSLVGIELLTVDLRVVIASVAPTSGIRTRRPSCPTRPAAGMAAGPPPAQRRGETGRHRRVGRRQSDTENGGVQDVIGKVVDKVRHVLGGDGDTDARSARRPAKGRVRSAGSAKRRPAKSGGKR